MVDSVLDREQTILAGASNYGTGNYGDGIYSGGSNNYVIFEVKPYNEVWEPTMVICQTNSQSFTQFAVYYDIADPSTCLGMTYNGNQDTVYIPAVEMTANHRLIGVWFGGDVGSQASASLVGTSGQLNE
jgi:hypothetical protein